MPADQSYGSLPPTYLDAATALFRHGLAQSDVQSLLAGVPTDGRGHLVERLVGHLSAFGGILSLSHGADANMPLHDRVPLVADALRAAIRAEACQVFLIDAAVGELLCLRPTNSATQNQRFPASLGVTGAAFTAGTVIVPDVAAERRFLREVDTPEGVADVRSMLCQPFRLPSGETVGVLQLVNKQVGAFDAADAAIAELAGRLVGQLIAQNNSFSEADTRSRLMEASPQSDFTQQFDAILSKILDIAIDILDADRGTIFLYDRTSHELYSGAVQGLGNRGIRMPADHGIAGDVFRTGEAATVRDAYADPRFNPASDRQLGYRTRNVTCVPIVSGGHGRAGVIQVINKRDGSFDRTDERRLRVLADQVGVALDNWTLFKEMVTIKSFNESILRSLSNGVLTIDMQGKVSFVNQAAQRILRLEGVDIVGKPIEEIFKDLNSWVIELIDEVAESSKDKNVMNTELAMDDDEWVAVNLTIVPLMNSDSALLGFMLVLEDMTREKEFRRMMSRYVSHELIDQLTTTQSALGGTMQEVSVLFADIRSFTSLTEHLGASGTVAMLNDYFSFMEDVIANRRGMIDKYIGDALMALFGAPIVGDDDAANAVYAATDMHQALRMLNQRRIAEQQKPIKIGIGISTGQVITGNIGSSKRMDFTVIGDPVNLASRIESLTKQYGVGTIVCDNTFPKLDSALKSRRLDVVRVRGQQRSTTLFEILEHRTGEEDAPLFTILDSYAEGLELYIAGNWDAALAKFGKAAEIAPIDKATLMMVDRCRMLLTKPPESWDGVWTLD